MTHSLSRFQQIALIVARLLLAYLFFTQLWWKAPPTFGCSPDYAFASFDASGSLHRTSGLCDWIGVQAAWASRPHPVLAANLDNQGGSEIAVDVGFLAAANGAFIDAFVKPNIRWFGYVVFGMEAVIFVSLFLGLFSRLGGLVALALSLQLWVGLAGISNPFEWEWSYNFLPVLSLLMIAFASGRYFGLDALLRPRLVAAASKGNKLARVLAWAT
ncbi:MAG: hypothetical protein HY870_01990 [Chloroflexi bacterium]|nr:hypothetical protein [Chloroflexota bacterium]